MSASRDAKDQKEAVVCPESTIESAPRRDFIRKAALATAAAGVGASLFGKNIAQTSSAKSTGEIYCCVILAFSQLIVGPRSSDQNDGSTNIPGLRFAEANCCGLNQAPGISSASVNGSPNQFGLDFWTGGFFCNPYKRMSITQCGSVGIGTDNPSSTLCVAGPFKATSAKCAAVNGVSCCSFGVQGCSPHSFGVYGTSCTSCGVVGLSTKAIGVYGQSCTCVGVMGYSFNSVGVRGCSCTIGVLGGSSAIGVKGVANAPGAVPIVARGASGQTANLQAWEKACGVKLSVVNKCGWLGIGRPCAPTTLAVKGSVSANIVSPSGAYKMKSSDYAVLASADVTLPAASTAAGMIVFIKNIGTTAITVSASGTNKIEGKSSEILSKEYASLYLISDGVSNWYMVANEKK
jgi:hypothetical protein